MDQEPPGDAAPQHRSALPPDAVTPPEPVAGRAGGDAPPAGPRAGGSERDEELGVMRRIQGQLADVDRALERLDDGSYGTCEVCGEALADGLLADAPAARLCAEHRAATTG